MPQDLGELVRQEANRRLKIHEQWERRRDRQKAWEKNRQKFFGSAKFLGTTALLFGGLMIGNKLVNTVPPREFKHKIKKYENKIIELEKDSASYVLSTQKLQEENATFEETNKELQNQIIVEKNKIRTHNFSGKGIPHTTVQIYKNGKAKTGIINNSGKINITWEDKNKTFLADSIIAFLDGYKRAKATNVSIGEKVSYNLQLKKIPESRKEIPITPQAKYPLVLNGKKTKGANITAWHNKKELKPKDYGTTYTFSWTGNSKSIVIDSIIGALEGYKRMKIIDLQVNEQTTQNFILEKISSEKENKIIQTKPRLEQEINMPIESGDKKRTRKLTAAPLKERGNKLILESGVYEQIQSINIPSGKTLIIEKGVIIQKSPGFGINATGGSLHVKGTQENPVGIIGGEGIELINSEKNKVSYLVLSDIIDYDTDDGGAFTLRNTEIYFDNLTVNNAQTAGSGGSIAAYRSDVELTTSKLVRGKAGFYGGNLYIYDSPYIITNSTITKGSAKKGGNIYVESTKIRDIKEGKKAYAEKPYIVITTSEVTQGVATTKGGGICLIDIGTKITNTEISHCQAQYGAGVYGEKGAYDFRTSNIHNNIATVSGGGGYFVKIGPSLDSFRQPFSNNKPNNFIEK